MPPGRFRALVVDDETAVRELTVRALGRDGFQCEIAANGAEALALARTTDYDIVITDLRMPEMHGHALVTELLKQPDPPAILILTGVIEPRLAIDLVERGVDDVLYKPFDYSMLSVKAHALATRRAEKLAANAALVERR